MYANNGTTRTNTRSIGQRRRILAIGLTLLLLILSGVWLVISTGIAHAATHDAIGFQTAPQTCFDNPTAELCDNVSPAVAKCTQDVQSAQSVRAIRKGTWVGYVQLRYSPHCQSYWVRAVGFAKSSIVNILATAQYANSHPSDGGSCAFALFTNTNGCVLDPDGGMSTYTSMAFQQRPLASLSFGTFVFADGTSMDVYL